MKKNNFAFVVIIIVLFLVIGIGILCLKFVKPSIPLPVEEKEVYGVVDTSFLKINNMFGNTDFLFISYEGNKCGLVDSNSNVVADFIYDICYFQGDNAIISDSDYSYLVNVKGDVLIKDKNEILGIKDFIFDKFYFLTSNRNECLLYDENGEYKYTVKTNDCYEIGIVGDYVILGNTVTNYLTSETIKIDDRWKMGKYYVFDLYKDNGYYIYSLSNKEIKKYDEIVSKNDYSISFKVGEETLILDYEGNVLEDGNIRKIGNKFKLDYSSCLKGAILLDKDGNKIQDKCYSLVSENLLKNYDYFLGVDVETDKVFIIYDKSNIIELGMSQYYDSVGDFIEVGEFVFVDYYDDGGSVLFDKNGNKKENFCTNTFYEITPNKYLCADLFDYYIIDSNLNVISDKYRYLECNGDGACIFEDNSSKKGLIIDNEVIVEPAFSEAVLSGNKVYFKTYSGYEVLSLNYSNKVMSKDDIIFESKINVEEVNIKGVIKEYELESIENIIYDNEELFKRYAYVVLNNDKIGSYKRRVLLLFNVIADNKELFREESFFPALNELTIVKNDDLNGTVAAGTYTDNSKYINLLDDSSNVINHELMHFIDFNINYDDYDSIYECDNEYYFEDEVSKMNNDKKKTCFREVIGDSTFITEAGAEFNMARYAKDVSRAYSNGTLIYYALSYLFGEEFMEDVYFSANGTYLLYKKMSSYMTYEEYMDFISVADDITSIYVSYEDKDYNSMSLKLIKLYRDVTGKEWYEDSIFKLIMNFFISYSEDASKLGKDVNSHLFDISLYLDDLINNVNKEYYVATSGVGMTLKEGKTYIDINVWNNLDNFYLRFEYDSLSDSFINDEILYINNY